MKTCYKCKESKPLTSFYLDKSRKDGHKNRCKNCDRLDLREKRLRNPETYKAKTKRDYENNRARRIKYQSDYYKEHRLKVISHRKVSNALKSGKLEKKPCEVCGNPNVHAHHDQYERQLEVRWLCPLHHMRHHSSK